MVNALWNQSLIAETTDFRDHNKYEPFMMAEAQQNTLPCCPSSQGGKGPALWLQSCLLTGGWSWAAELPATTPWTPRLQKQKVSNCVTWEIKSSPAEGWLKEAASDNGWSCSQGGGLAWAGGFWAIVPGTVEGRGRPSSGPWLASESDAFETYCSSSLFLEII